MSLEISIPAHIEKRLQIEWGDDFSRRAVEALAIEGYRSGALSLGEVAEMLLLSINDADGLLKKRGVLANYDIEELNADERVLEALLAK
jgi:predicted HTH domain antitoxin